MSFLHDTKCSIPPDISGFKASVYGRQGSEFRAHAGAHATSNGLSCVLIWTNLHTNFSVFFVHALKLDSKFPRH